MKKNGWYIIDESRRVEKKVFEDMVGSFTHAMTSRFGPPHSAKKGRPVSTVRSKRRAHFGGDPIPKPWWSGEVDQMAPDDAPEWEGSEGDF